MRCATPEELASAQARGRARQNASHCPQRTILLSMLREGPVSMGRIRAEVRGSAETLNALAARLRREGRVRRVDAALAFADAECVLELGVELGHELRGNRAPKPAPVMQPRVRRSTGSGVIAGTITIGRGSVWGASIL
jgi:hypothetical protein